MSAWTRTRDVRPGRLDFEVLEVGAPEYDPGADRGRPQLDPDRVSRVQPDPLQHNVLAQGPLVLKHEEPSATQTSVACDGKQSYTQHQVHRRPWPVDSVKR